MKPYYSEAGIEIYLGDCREVLPTLTQHDVIITDPPYGIGYVHGAERGPNASLLNEMPVIGDDQPFDPRAFLIATKHIFWGANHYAHLLPPSAGWLVWDKRCNTVVNDQSDAELAWTDFLTTARVHYCVWDGFRRGNGEKNTARVHPTQKAVSLMRWCVALTGEGTILDPFAGSGTTLVAAKDLGRRAIGIEIEERYCEIAANRLRQSVMQFGSLQK